MKIKDMPNAVGNIDIDSTDIKCFFAVIWHFTLWGIGLFVGGFTLLLCYALILKL